MRLFIKFQRNEEKRFLFAILVSIQNIHLCGNAIYGLGLVSFLVSKLGNRVNNQQSFKQTNIEQWVRTLTNTTEFHLCKRQLIHQSNNKQTNIKQPHRTVRATPAPTNSMQTNNPKKTKQKQVELFSFSKECYVIKLIYYSWF